MLACDLGFARGKELFVIRLLLKKDFITVKIRVKTSLCAISRILDILRGDHLLSTRSARLLLPLGTPLVIRSSVRTDPANLIPWLNWLELRKV
jgi:hypothetical protein